MELIADALLAAGALGAAAYCFVLARRLQRFNDLEKGVGGAVAVLSSQVDDLTRTLETARGTAADSTQSLDELTQRAESAAKKLELLVASMHDLPEAQSHGPPSQSDEQQVLFRRHVPDQTGST
jgi:methyl-accepting chemotaxis protein